jgi:hypothetical protein
MLYSSQLRDLTGELRPQAFLCTDLKADPVNKGARLKMI